MDDHDLRLKTTRRKVAEAELRVARQHALVEDARRLGRSTEKAEQLLAVLETALATLRESLKIQTDCLLHLQFARAGDAAKSSSDALDVLLASDSAFAAPATCNRPAGRAAASVAARAA